MKNKTINMSKKILLSLVVVVAATAVVVGATTAFFSDTETSTGNTFTAGAIDLKVDSDCHYYQMDANGEYQDVGCGTWVPNPEGTPEPVAVGVWEENDLGAIHRFFNFADIKPGDKGEDTISLHVYDNDAWGRILMDLTGNYDNSCTEPEQGTNDEDCTVAEPEDQDSNSGELLDAMLGQFSMWLDQGLMPGFQNVDSEGNRVDSDPDFDAAGNPVGEPGIQPVDPWEGDNVWQREEGNKWNLGSEKELSEVLSNAYGADYGVGGLDNCTVADGHTDYGYCNGLAEDGRMVGSTTYYFGLNWELPWDTGNEVQTDSLSGDLSFEVEQHRNNPSPWSL